MLQYYIKHMGRNKAKYDHTNSKWIYVDCIISTLTINYIATNKLCTLDRFNAEVHMTKRDV